MVRLAALAARFGPGLALAAATLGIVLAIVFLRFLWRDDLAELEPATEPLVTEARLKAVDDRQPVVAGLGWKDPAQVLAPALTGTVTAVYVANGASVAAGDVVLSVDGVDRMAVATESPFWRTLEVGAVGRDVAMLEALLNQYANFNEEADKEYTESTAAAVSRLAQDFGAPAQSTFDPAWLIWLPDSPFSIGEVAVSVGEPAMRGAPLLIANPELIEVEFRGADGGAIPIAEGEWIFEVAGREILLRRDADARLLPETLGEIAEAVEPGSETVEGFVARAEPRTAVIVPASSVLPGGESVFCVWEVADGAFLARRVEVGTGTFSETEVIGLEAGTAVLVNPGQVADPTTCR